MKRFFCIALFFIFSSGLSVAQNDTVQQPSDNRKPQESKLKSFDWRNRLYWGGTLGAWFGSSTFIDLSPLVGVKITDKFSAGIGVIYNYFSYNYGGSKYETNLYGARLYGRYFIFENVFLQVGWDRINRDNPYSYLPNQRIWIDNVLIGGGLRYPISDRIFCTAMGMWNLNQTPLSPYANPIIQIGFVGGF